ncbi:MAG: MBL fold metallo-hydrolase [Halobacteriaceae archaeon]
MEVTLLGTGDTTGTPTPGCDCDTCRRARDQDVERTRFSVHVYNERTDQSLLLDASPDFRTQFLRQSVPLPDAAVISHIHFDHLDGLGNAYRLVDSLTVYAAAATDPATGESVAETVARKYDYLDRVTVEPRSPYRTFDAAGFDVTLVPVDHPPLHCYGIRIDGPTGSLALTGDTTYAVPDRSRAVLADADLLLADALVPATQCGRHPAGGAHHDADGVPRTFGTKHMTREGALALATDLDADRTRLVHASHYYPAEDAFEEPLAVDGERYTL